MNKTIRFTPPSKLISIEDLDGELKKYGIPEHARAAAVEVAHAFDKGFKIPKANCTFRFPPGLTDEQMDVIELRMLAALSLYHEAWRTAILDFSGTLQNATIKAAMGIKPQEA